MVGALDCFGYDRAQYVANIEAILNFARATREQDTKQDSLFAAAGISFTDTLTLKPAAPATLEQKFTWEKDLLGLYLSAHPLDPFMPYFKKFVTPIAEVEIMPRDGWVICVGVVESVMKKIIKKGDIVLFLVMQDMLARIDILVCPKTYQRTKDLWV